MRRFLTTGLLVLACWPAAHGQELSARAAVERERVYVGQPFAFQIQVEGSESPDPPNLEALKDFRVEQQGGQQNSSQSITIVNGRMTRVVNQGYIFNYRLSALRTGDLVIPPITVRAGGQTARTQQVAIRAAAPEENEDVKLQVSLSDQRAYVGQPVTMTVRWFIGRNVRSYTFNMPVLADSRFTVIDPSVNPDPNRHIQVNLPTGPIYAERLNTTLDGRQYMEVHFRKVLIPRQAGDITIPAASVSGEALIGQRRSLFDDFFSDPFGDDFFGRSPLGEQWAGFAVPSDPLRLQVLPLPAAGRPASFSGLVGDYRMSAEATPVRVNVGDPITLTVRVSGPDYLEDTELPPLERQPDIARDFMIPPDRAAGLIQGAAKVFTQTLRAKSADVYQIPPIELAYFNPKSGSYQVARTEPIPLQVSGTRIITASDAEGQGEVGEAPSRLESAEGGISYNYEGPEVLANQVAGLSGWLRSPAWLGALALPPAIYFGLLGFFAYTRWRDADPVARRARRAYKELTGALSGLKADDTDAYYAAVLDALRRYLGGRLNLSPGALTFADARTALEARGVEPALLDDLRLLFQRSEAGRYAGAQFPNADTSLMESAQQIAARLERALG